MIRPHVDGDGTPWPMEEEAPDALPWDDDEAPGQFAERRLRLIAARDLLGASLVILDECARSPAAAIVDMALNLINTEIGG